MNRPVLESVKDILGETLGLGARRATLSAATPLFGSMPEFDSLGVVQLALAIEAHFGIRIDDEDFGGELFETVGTLARYVERRLESQTGAVAAE